MAFVLQRQTEGIGSKAVWLDDKTYSTKDAAIRALSYERASQQLSIAGAGGSSWSGRSVQNMRIIEIVA